ncbi:hypothetical protein BDZ91DRAFT_800991 [Kalaharituber pfeilii]|nr:hypothetical protein BDZ91DRAFT_800991 [Kalaharituber pfeilii]
MRSYLISQDGEQSPLQEGKKPNTGAEFTVDIEAQHRLFFSGEGKYGLGQRTHPFLGFFTPSQLEDGLLQAAPAHEDCLVLPSERTSGLSNKIEDIVGTRLRRQPYLPPEIQIQIISHYVQSSSYAECGFCHLFALSKACRVSRLWYHYTVKLLYRMIPLDFSIFCQEHLHLSSKHIQMQKRIPLLVQTLQSRPDLADLVRKIRFPNGKVAGKSWIAPGALSYWVSCSLEKRWLPGLIRSCRQLESVDGLEDILSPLFNGEHYCFLDNDSDGDHGYLAQALFETTAIKRWVWGHGYIRKLGDRVCGNFHTFLDCHRNWNGLEQLSVIGLGGVTPQLLWEVIDKLPALTKFTFGFGSTMTEEASCTKFLVDLFTILPARVNNLVLVDKATSTMMEVMMNWVSTVLSNTLSQGKPYYQPTSSDKETLVIQKPSSFNTKLGFLVDSENIASFWNIYGTTRNSQYLRVLTGTPHTGPSGSSSSTTVTSIKIYI